MEIGKISHKRIIAMCLCVLAVIYFGYHMFNSLRAEASFFIARPYTARDSMTFTGYLFREETVLTAHTSGMYSYHVYDGEKVAVGKTIADVYHAGNDALTSAIEDYKKQIEILRRSSSLGRLTLEEVEQKIDRLTFSIAEKQTAGETAAADALGDELLVLMAKKDLLESGRANYESEIILLENELSRAVSSLGTPAETVQTSTSGYFYAETDGYESVFTLEAAEELTLQTFDALLQEPAYATPNAVGTLLTSSKWYYAAKIDASDAEGFFVGAMYQCLFLDNGYSESIPMTLVSRETDGEDALLIFFSSSLPRDFDITRCQRMEAVKAEYTGLRVPSDVVRFGAQEEGGVGVTYVYVMKEGAAYQREIEILWEQNGYFIVSELFEGVSPMANLKLNDLIIIDEPDLYEGKFIS